MLLATSASAVLLPKTIMHLTSTAFQEGGSIPILYTCQGEDISPPLQWTNAPAKTKSFVLIVDDPDAPGGTWTHWLVYNLPPDLTQLSENITKAQTLPNGARQGLNGFRRPGYGGPCPPAGKAHRYFFKLYALDVFLNVEPGAARKDVERSIGGHILGVGNLMGTYQRK